MRVGRRESLRTLSLLLVTSFLHGEAKSADMNTLEAQFMSALLRGDLPSVKALFVASPNLVHQVDKWGFTLLHLSATEDQLKVQAYLIQAGADVNARTNDGITPLHIASNPEFAELLLRHGADMNARAKSGDTPLHSIASEDDKDDVLAVLIRFGANKTLRNARGETALDIAKSRHDQDKVEALSAH